MKNALILTICKNYILLLLLVFSGCKKGGFKKSNNTINSSTDTTSFVLIGGQNWMKFNLNTTKFRNGDIIKHAITDKEWNDAYISKTPAWCYRNNDSLNGQKYGKLYNWFAVNDSRVLAPIGWHIPSHSDWIELSNSLGGQSNAGSKLKSKNGWFNSGNGSNESGFNGLPSGRRIDEGLFQDPNKEGYWWSATEGPFADTDAWAVSLYFIDGNLNIFPDGKGSGLSIRCIKD